MNITIPTNTLKAMLGFAAKKDVRYWLNALCLDFGPRYTALVGTTGSILAAYKLDDSRNDPALGRVILPRDAIETALKAAGKASEITITNTHIGLVPYTPVDARYPDWQAVIPMNVDDEALPAQINPDLLVPFQKAAKLLGDTKWANVHLWHNGPERALLVSLKDENFVGVLMPLRELEAAKKPGWL